METEWVAAVFGLVGAVCAAIWSFLMAKYVAGPRAKQLMIGTLKGDTPEDKQIVAEIREQLVRPEVQSITDAFEMPEVDLEPVLNEVRTLVASIPDEISKHLDMHMKGMKANEAKQLKALLDEMNIEGVAEEKREELIRRMPTLQKAGLKLMTLKIPKAYKDDNPLTAAVLDQARGLVGEALLSMDEQAHTGTVVQNTTRGKFGVR